MSLRKIKNLTLGAVFGYSENVDPEKATISSDDFQDSDGAPVEKKSPLQNHVTTFSTFYLIIQGVLGTGIFSTPATILDSMGSIGSTYVLWVTGFIVTLLQVFMYLEYASYYRHRSGAEVVYLEQAFPKPRFLIPVVYAAMSICLSFATSSASAFSRYIFRASGHEPSAWQVRGLGVGGLAIAAIITLSNTNLAIKINNVIGFVKTVFILFVAFSTFAVLAGSTQTPKSAAHAIFKDAWKGTTTDGNTVSNAFLKVIFSFVGANYAFGVIAESHPTNTIRTCSILIPATMGFIFILYILTVTGYYAGIADFDEIINSGNLVACTYFEHIFGTQNAVDAMSAFVAISAFGHLLTAYISHSRVLRECGRQGVLPFPRAWASVKPFGTPLLPTIVTFIVNVIVLIAPPPGDAYNFVVDLGSYSTYIFYVFLAVGLFKVRQQRKLAGLGYREIHIPTPLLIIVLLFSLFIIAMAFVPPKGTLIGSDVSFFYAVYPLTTIGIFLACVAYYVIWEYVVPRIGKYRHRVAAFELDSGEKGHKIVKVPVAELEEWDRTHASGTQLYASSGSETDSESKN